MTQTSLGSSRPTVSRQRAARNGWALALTSLAYFMVALDSLVVITAMPDIGRSLHGSIGTLEWTINAYTLGAAGIITAAALGDRFGRRRIFTIGLGLFSAASAGCALAPNAGALIAARALQGIGGAIIIPLSLTILTISFPPERRGAVIGIWGGIAGLAVASGPVVGGAVTQGLDWHWIFWINVPIGISAAVAARLRLPETHGGPTPIDIPALTLVAVMTTALIWALIRAADNGWTDSAVMVGLVVSIAAVIGLVARERRAPAPMLPPRLFTNRGFTAAVVSSLLMLAALMGAVFLTAQYFQTALHYGPLATAVRLLPWTATPLVVAPIAGAIADRVGTRRILITGLTLQAVGLALFADAATLSPSYLRLCLSLLVAGVGVSMALPTAATAAVSAVLPAEIGTASGVANTLQRVGGALGIAVVTSVFAGYGHLGASASFVSGFRPAVAVAALLSLMGAAAALTIPRRKSSRTGTVTPSEPALATRG
jgi:EmrB/QacA subfamily drug resistance transporter